MNCAAIYRSLGAQWILSRACAAILVCLPLFWVALLCHAAFAQVPQQGDVVGGKRTTTSRYASYSFPRRAPHPSYYSRDQIDTARRRVKETSWGQRYLQSLTSLQNAPVMTLTEAQLVSRIPPYKAFYLPMDPVSRTSTSYMDQYWEWSPTDPDRVRSKTSGVLFPNSRFPMNKTLKVVSATGKTHEYHYYEDAEGIRYFFNSWVAKFKQDSVIHTLSSLGRAYVLTGDTRYARRAALLLNRLSDVFPEWPIHGPGKGWGVAGPRGHEEFFFSADPPYSYDTGRFRTLAAADIMLAAQAAMAYDLIYDSGELERLSKEIGEDVRINIERDLIFTAVDFVMHFMPDTRSPGRSMDMATIAAVFNDPALARAALRTYRLMFNNWFNFDGMWQQGNVSYHLGAISRMLEFPEVFERYADPEDYEPVDALITNMSIYDAYPQLGQIYRAARELFLPNGYALAVNDSWPLDHHSRMAPFEERAYAVFGGDFVPPSPTEYSVFRRPENSLLPQPPTAFMYRSAVLADSGFALLRSGEGDDRTQLFLDFSRFSGHSHRDALQISLFAKGYELSPDLGYTYTPVRGWNNATASHNTVVVDGTGQSLSYGTATAFLVAPMTPQIGRPVQYAEASAVPVYAPQQVSQYERAVALIPVGVRDHYVVDLFRIEGGSTHDWFLHGAADYQQALHTNVRTKERGGTLFDTIPGGARTVSQEAAHHELRNNRGDDKETSALLERIRRESGYDFVRIQREGLTDQPIELSFELRKPIEKPFWGYPFSAAPPRQPVFEIAQAPDVHLSTTVLPAPGTQLFLTEAPGIRRAGERSELTDQAYMPLAVVRREAGAAPNVFAAVHQPYSGTPFIRSISQIGADSERGMVALQIEHVDGTDYVIASASPQFRFLIPTDRGALAFAGRFGFIRVVDGNVIEATIVEGQELALGDSFTVSLPATRFVGRILRLHDGRGAPSYLDIDTEWPAGTIGPGNVVFVRHSDGSRTAYPLATAERQTWGTRLWLSNVNGLTLSSGMITGTTSNSIVSDVQHPKAIYDAWFRGKTLLAGGREFTIEEVPPGAQSFRVRQTSGLSTLRPGMGFDVVATRPNDRVELPAFLYIRLQNGRQEMSSNTIPTLQVR